METRSLKALSILRLQGYLLGNNKETIKVQKETRTETPISFSVSLCRNGNKETTSENRNASPRTEVSDWRPEPKAWLTDEGEFRTQGVFPGEWPDGGFTPQIIRLTEGNIPLQKKLLLLHVPNYSGPLWKYSIEEFEHLAAKMTDTDITRHEAELAAAKHLHLGAFIDELI